MNASNPPPITVQAHEPERRRRSVVVAPCCCCSCCCCCLHSIGSLTAAITAGATESGQPAAGLYWRCVVGVLIATAVGSVVMTGNPGGGFLVVLIAILALPVVQLAASLVAVVLILVLPCSDRAAFLWAIGKITLWTVLGAVIGLLMMFGLAAPFLYG